MLGARHQFPLNQHTRPSSGIRAKSEHSIVECAVTHLLHAVASHALPAYLELTCSYTTLSTSFKVKAAVTDRWKSLACLHPSLPVWLKPRERYESRFWTYVGTEGEKTTVLLLRTTPQSAPIYRVPRPLIVSASDMPGLSSVSRATHGTCAGQRSQHHPKTPSQVHTLFQLQKQDFKVVLHAKRLCQPQRRALPRNGAPTPDETNDLKR
jgi:hypothetical protein